ncbi:MAG: NADH-quinone oxidoreductase subunit NuoH [Deltaproteobacteria bacterium]|nr:NADH-quinone oxidoreductase subunit NuoH [Deltaproteobacteria bacterium]
MSGAKALWSGGINLDTIDLLIRAVMVFVIVGIVLSLLPFLTWVERRGMAVIQDRMGPNRVGPFGLLQPVADGVKFLFKESAVLPQADRFLYFAAPFFAFVPALLAIAVLPFGEHLVFGVRVIPFHISDLHVGLLFLLAVASLGVYGTLFGGWASNNKFSVLGALRAASQMISYEVVMGLALVSMILIYGTFSLKEMVRLQSGFLIDLIPRWGIFLQPFSALLFGVTAFAETNRIPFDLPEGESELVAGYHTEYGGLKFATFFLAEYLHMFTMSALMVLLFLGGWHFPGFDSLLSLLIAERFQEVVLPISQLLVFSVKLALVLWFFVWVRFTLPRFRYDQLMELGWRRLLPLSLVNVLITAVFLYWLEGPPQ